MESWLPRSPHLNIQPYPQPPDSTQTPFCTRHIGMLEFKAELTSTGFPPQTAIRSWENERGVVDPPLVFPPQPAMRTAALCFNYCSPYIQVIDCLTPGWWAWGCSRLCFKWSLNHFIMEQLFLLHWLPACAGIVVSLQLSNLVLNSQGSFIICLFPRMPREGRNVNHSSHLWWKIKHCSYMDNLI